MSEADLRDIAASLQGDGAGYARLVERYQNDIAAQMWRFTQDRLALEELVQDVFVEAYGSLRNFRGDAPFLHWLRRIATRVGYRFWKNRKRQDDRRGTVADWEKLPARDTGDMDRLEAQETLALLMNQLNPADRLVLTLVHLEELSVAEAARRTGWTRITVKVRAHRARKKLKALLEKHVQGLEHSP